MPRSAWIDAGLGALAANPEGLRNFRRPILDTWNLLEEMLKPTIAQIHGACIGGAMELVLACDTWTKANLRRNGGYGYEHLMRRIVPALQDLAGADDATMEQIVVGTPRRLLDR